MGSGKTESTIRQTIRQVLEGSTCILTHPTIELNWQVYRRIKELAPEIHVEIINSDTCPNKVVLRLSEHLRQPLDRPHIIITTWDAFERLPFIVRPERYQIKCDEVPQTFKSSCAQIPCNHAPLTNSISIARVGPRYARVTVHDKGKLRSIVDNRQGDAINSIFQPFARTILDPKWDTFVDYGQYEEFCNGRTDDPYLRTFSLLRPTIFHGFASVSLLGARAQESLLCRWFERNGVNFIEDQEIQESLRYREQKNGHLIDFHYLSETNWSLYAQEQRPDLRSKFTAAVIEKMKGRPFGWLDNKPFEAESPFNHVQGAERLPHASHGRNDFQHLDNLAILTAFNLPPPISDFLQDYAGISKEDQKIAHDYERTSQTIGRISIRDLNNSCRKTIILPDRQNAERQSQIFPGSCVHSMNVDDRETKSRGRPKEHENSTERQRARRQKLKDEQDALVAKYDLCIQRMTEAGNQNLCNEIPIDTIRNNVTAYQGSIINSRREGKSFPFVSSPEDFGNYLKGLSKRELKNKDDNILLMSALCVPVPNEESSRAEVNALIGRHVIHDFDDSELKPLTLSRIFPDLEFYCYNSYNNSKGKLRYRTIFLTDDVVTPAIYKSIWYQIVQLIENKGYYGFRDKRPKGDRKVHGIDNKPNIVTPYYLPCQAKSGKSFFYHYNSNRRPLVVKDWIANPIMTRFDDLMGSEGITPITVQEQIGERQQIIDAALNHYRKFTGTINPKTNQRSGSNETLFTMALTLKRAGVDRFSADAAMTQAANESNSRSERMSDKSRYLKKYWK